ncbi:MULTISPECIES: GlxA family transcriptional regulator [unclassified Sphingomonas]|uniref:GlxA family transcriptional regulator n=1 Tax=unclassified Sphingomonas TaxID=196159 RepID=UPI001FD0EDC3|nr:MULTISPECIES: DJ-1/PfpI family protein [unclassified Sphingomonas]
MILVLKIDHDEGALFHYLAPFRIEPFYRSAREFISGSDDKDRVDCDMIEIAIVMYSGAQLAAVLGMTDLLIAADRAAARSDPASGDTLVVSHWAAMGARGTLTRVYSSASHATTPSICILPPALDGRADDTEPVVTRWLQERHADGAVLTSVCLGAFLLGETGLLNGRTVTTHWAYEDRFRARFPQTKLDTDRIVIDDGDIMTAGGVMAWADLCLTIIDRFLGDAVMIEVARSFLIDPPGRRATTAASARTSVTRTMRS